MLICFDFPRQIYDIKNLFWNKSIVLCGCLSTKGRIIEVSLYYVLRRERGEEGNSRNGDNLRNLGRQSILLKVEARQKIHIPRAIMHQARFCLH